MCADMSTSSCISQWGDGSCEIHTVSFSADETSCYSLSSDGKVCDLWCLFHGIVLLAVYV